MGDADSKFRIIHEVVSQPGNALHIDEMCQVAGVSRSGYYRWLAAAPLREAREEQDREDFDLILEAYQFRGYDKGARGIYMRLLHHKPEPIIMNIKKIRRLMKKFNLFCPIRKANPYRRMAKALRTNTVADNLLKREFRQHGPRKVLLTDITYIPYNDTFCYLSTILDAYTREVLAYVLSDSLEVDFVLETVNILIRDHGFSLSDKTLIHSDQGCHYTSYKFIDIVKDAGLRQSMSRKGNCWDNAPQESFYGHMKDSIDISGCTTFEEVKTIIDDYMDYYNNDRYQWDLAKLSPVEFYKYVTTGEYPIKGIRPPSVPIISLPVDPTV